MQFNKDTLRADLATFPCKHCKTIGNVRVTLEQEPITHFARIECEACGYWLDWLGWPPERPSERKRRRQRITTLGEDRCEMCLRSRFEIPPPGRLEEHHVVEWAEGGSDDPANTRILCTSCQGLVHWARTYFGHYHPAAAAETA